MTRTYVYIDGFNLYYRALKGTPYKWLDLHALCQLLLPNNQILAIKYFTARVNARPHDPDQPVRQQTYLRAIRTCPVVEVIYGHFLPSIARMPLASPPPGGPNVVEVLKTEEKGSDVNFATHLLWDAVQNRYDVAAVITNDSDLVCPLRIVRTELGKKVALLNPSTRHRSKELHDLADYRKDLRSTHLAQCQFTDPLLTPDGRLIRKPRGW